MKKTLIIGAVVLFFFFAFLVTSIAVLLNKGRALDAESKQYVDAAVPAIVADWDIAQLQKRLSPEFKSVTKDGDLEKLFAIFQKLGKLKSYEGCRGQSNISVTTQRGKVISAGYVASATFENGPARIQINLIKHDNQWQVLGFRVDSKLFLDRMTIK